MNARQETIIQHSLTSHGTIADYIAATGFVLAVLSGIAAVSAGFGSRLEWWHFRTGFTILRFAAYCGAGAAVISLIGGIALRKEHHRSLVLAATAGILVGLVTAGVPWSYMNKAQQVPRIHDITTDTLNPPVFLSIMPHRQDAPNSAEYEGPTLAAQQQTAYPDIRPAVFPLSPASAFEAALNTARDMGWKIVDANPAMGRIEATDTTFWFGFKDDIVIRVSEIVDGSRIDIRSLSRVGVSDVGTNAERIRTYLNNLARMEGRGG